MPTLIIMRHSLTVANERGILMGSKFNSPISEKGKELARAKALLLKKEGLIPEKVYVSKLLRTKQTAEIILEELRLDIEIVELEGLNERDFGKYDGKPIQELRDGFNKFGPNPYTVEVVDHFVNRVVTCLQQIKSETKQSNLIVTHSNSLNVMRASLFDPKKLQRYWEKSTPDYCEGFTYIF
jgi:broad specificity phosphatase PhoE